nr:zinc finger, CCHC-type [Tanacetum cinerariifolium]
MENLEVTEPRVSTTLMNFKSQYRQRRFTACIDTFSSIPYLMALANLRELIDQHSELSLDHQLSMIAKLQTEQVDHETAKLQHFTSRKTSLTNASNTRIWHTCENVRTYMMTRDMNEEANATKRASFRLSKCRFCSPGRRKKLWTRCSSQPPELYFVSENARVNSVKPEVGCLFETPSKSWRMQNKPMNSKASSKEQGATKQGPSDYSNGENRKYFSSEHSKLTKVKDEKRVWFEVELQGTQGDRESEIFQEKVPLGIKVGANITVTEVPGQEGAKGNVAEKKKVKESMKANLKKLLKYKAWLTRRSSFRDSSIG